MPAWGTQLNKFVFNLIWVSLSSWLYCGKADSHREGLREALLVPKVRTAFSSALFFSCGETRILFCVGFLWWTFGSLPSPLQPDPCPLWLKWCVRAQRRWRRWVPLWFFWSCHPFRWFCLLIVLYLTGISQRYLEGRWPLEWCHRLGWVWRRVRVRILFLQPWLPLWLWREGRGLLRWGSGLLWRCRFGFLSEALLRVASQRFLLPGR